MVFKDITGMDDVKQSLVSSVRNNHLAHALLFSGREGGAALALALAFATYVNCANPGHDDACGECPSCQKNHKYIHPDLHFVFPVCATKSVSGKDVVSASFLKEWRNFLAESPYGTHNDWNEAFGGDNKPLNISREESRHIIRNLSLKAFEGRYKIMLVWLPEFMHPTAANAILKVLEEPPENTLFLLVSLQPDNLLMTIQSRTQPFPVRPFSNDEVVGILTDRFNAEESRARQAAQLANGNLNEARKLLTEVEDDSHSMFREWMRSCYSRDYTRLTAWADQFQRTNRLAQQSMLRYGLGIMRETLLHNLNSEQLSTLSGEEKEFVVRFGSAISADMVSGISEELNRAAYHLERNANPKIVFLDLSLVISGIMRS